MCRKNLNTLTPAERAAFARAVNQLKQNGGYDVFPEMHSGAGSHGHTRPAFFPWHRQFIRQFEEALQQIDPNVWLPYWDFTVDNLNPTGTESLIWRDDFMGGPGDAAAGFAVNTGPFTGPAWNLTRNAFNPFDFPGNGGDVMAAMSTADYDSFHPRIERRPHGRAHTWTGGSVSDFQFSPRDPVFFLIHCNVDRLWAEWIADWEGTPGFEPYEPATGAPQGHNLGDSMWPWNGATFPFGMAPWTSAPITVRPLDVIDHTAMGYTYDSVDGCVTKRPIERLDDRRLIEVERLKLRLPKEIKEILPKELKERGPKELKERAAKEVKERGPKEIKDIREDIFIGDDLRPDLTRAALDFDDDPRIAELARELETRRAAARRRKGLSEKPRER